jgi:hypothetical protein
MNKAFWKSKILIWIPTIYCAILSGMRMFAPEDSGDAAFYAFLPMCFFFTAASHLSLLKKVDELETGYLKIKSP